MRSRRMRSRAPPQSKLGRFLGRLHPKRRALALKLAQAPDEALGAAAFAREHRRDDGEKIELPVRGPPPPAMPARLGLQRQGRLRDRRAR